MIKLTELEFNKLMRYTEAANSLEAQFALAVARLTEQVEAGRKIRSDYFAALCAKYPKLDKDAAYTPVEAEFGLKLNSKE